MAPNRLNLSWLRPLLATVALAVLAVLGGCGGGSGAPNNPYAAKPVPPGPLLILPSALTVYANTPASLEITGGVAPYTVTSSDPTILPLASSSSTGTIVLLPASSVAATVAVIVTVTDSVSIQATATITVNPAPIFNTLTVTPASSSCGSNTICSGQTATAKVTVTGAGGAGIPERQVQFDVVAGAFAIESSNPATPLVSTLTVVSDQFGVAQVIIEATAGVPTQPAQLRATELTTGEQQTTGFTIVQTVNGSSILSVSPTTVTIMAAYSNECSSGFKTDYYVYGGKPPYTVVASFPDAVTILGNPVQAAGEAFTAITTGICVNPLTFNITDSTGVFITATLINEPGSAAPPVAPPPPLSAIPLYPAGWTCAVPFTVEITGGATPYNISASPAGVIFTPSASPSAPGFVFVNAAVFPSGTPLKFLVVDTSSPQQLVSFNKTCP